ncbi:MAG: 2-C-methyl-D-erythritol 4-phosphate cytidylyltransferase [Candidatus Bipolaricaulis sp.]|nr:2-C-methyl-D-erythritol 4-phosphate cytidylyltransferase [Candidatus Bipolaricaulis sp.]
MQISAIIVAAGRGVRMGAAENKVFLPLGGMPILTRAIAAFASVPRVSEIVVVAREGEEEKVASLLPPGAAGRVRVVRGGAERRDSSLAGVRAATGDVVLIHDGARPLVPAGLIDRVIDGAAAHGACVPALAAVDTVRRVDRAGFLTPAIVERAGLVNIQTPQGFRTDLIRRCLADAVDPALPDDAAAVLAAGIPVATVAGERSNLKVTTAADLALAEALLARGGQRVVRSGEPG